MCTDCSARLCRSHAAKRLVMIRNAAARGKRITELAAERDEARAALRACARRCEHRCGEIATIRAGDETQQGGAFRYCDNPECRGGEPVLGDVPHAAALRAAGGGR